MTDKKSFMMYLDYEEHLKLLPSEEVGQLTMALFRYEKTREKPDFNGALAMAFSFIALQMDRDNAEYIRKCEKNSGNGKKGGRPPKNQTVSIKTQKSERFFEKPKKADTDTDTDTDTDILEDTDVSSCPERFPESEIPPARKSEIELMLNDKSMYPVYCGQIDKWTGLYPAVDVMQELRNMVGWIESNPTKRKTKNGINRFITGWLSKEQNRSGKKYQSSESPDTKTHRLKELP